MVRPSLKKSAQHQVTVVPPPAWYIGRFNNYQWSPSTKNDVLISTYQIKKEVCEQINLSLTGDTAIPTLNVAALGGILVDPSLHSFAKADINSSTCPDCEGYPALCVSNVPVDAWGFYMILQMQ